MISSILFSANMPSLADLKAFIAVAQLRSFRKAADRLGVIPSTLSHAVRNLERCLGVGLLHRTTRSVALTDAGKRLLAMLAPLLHELDFALGDVAGRHGSATGVLRINGSEPAVRLLLRTVVPNFLSAYPNVELELAANGALIDIVAEGFDAGIRLGHAVPKDMVAVRLCPDIRYMAVAAPAYLAQHGTPAMPDALATHRCIRKRYASGKRHRWEFERDDHAMAIDAQGPLTLDNHQLILEAAVAGLGIAYLPEPYASKALRDGRLSPVLEEWCPYIPGLFLYFPRSRHPSPPLRSFIEMVKGAIGRELDVSYEV